MWFDGVMQGLQGLLLCRRHQIHEDVAATDQVYPQKWRIVRRVVSCKNTLFTDGFVDLVAPSTPIERKKVSRW
ncbi:hypothetical protein KSC_051570 [Ktedonobacter sp. SOSP1-52]|nr:hypothetical protein KSC_051570 [Ktedonobacter sp. SOSP1-52]